MWKTFYKRPLDLLLSVPTFLILLPVFILLIIIIKIDSKGPAIYTQKRDGKDNKLFKIYKYRTMKTDTPEVAPALLGDASQYITRVGSVLRKTSLDELPQLINIIKGDMSIVGPRPPLWNEDELINLRKRHNINKLSPGLTGWAQINGRDEVEIDEKVMLDKYYLDNISLKLDIKIIALTALKVLKKEGIYEGSKSSIK